MEATAQQIPTRTNLNGLTVAVDLEPFAKFVNGTVTCAIRYEDRWSVHYHTAKREMRKSLPLAKVEG